MPTYTFRNIETGEIQEEIMPSDQVEQFTKDNPGLERVLKMPPPITTHISNQTRAGSDWQGLLKKIDKGAGRSSKINV